MRRPTIGNSRGEWRGHAGPACHSSSRPSAFLSEHSSGAGALDGGRDCFALQRMAVRVHVSPRQNAVCSGSWCLIIATPSTPSEPRATQACGAHGTAVEVLLLTRFLHPNRYPLRSKALWSACFPRCCAFHLGQTWRSQGNSHASKDHRYDRHPDGGRRGSPDQGQDIAPMGDRFHPPARAVEL